MNENDDNNNLLLPACVCGSLSVVKELIKAGVDVNLHNILNETPVTATCVFEHVHVLEELIKAGADLNLRNRLDETPLTVALQRGHFDLVKVLIELIEAGADENLSDDILTHLNQLHEKWPSEVYNEDSSIDLDFSLAFYNL